MLSEGQVGFVAYKPAFTLVRGRLESSRSLWLECCSFLVVECWEAVIGLLSLISSEKLA